MKDNRHLYTYNYFHQSKDFQNKPERTDGLIEVILKYKPKSVLDVGCGLGSVVHKLRKIGINATGVDFAPDLVRIWGKNHNNIFFIHDARELKGFGRYDLVFSSDFFEHIDEEDIDKVAGGMKSLAKNVITFVADDMGQYLNARQRELHVTHKPLGWWKRKLEGIDVFSSHDYE